jgi:hypothetical protein
MDSVTAIVILRLLHIVIGAAWLGAVVMVTFFISPTVRATGAVGGQFVGALMQRTHLPIWLLAAGAITILSGGALYGMFYAGIPWDALGPHVAYGVGGILALVAFAIGFFLSRPLGARFAALSKALASQGAPPNAAQVAERDALSARLGTLGLVIALLLLAATALMAVGRYL